MSNCGVFQVERSFWQKIGITDISEVSKKFYLPDNYEVLSIEERADIVDVIVASEDIPDRGEEGIPTVKPIYSYNTETGEVSLDHIEITRGE